MSTHIQNADNSYLAPVTNRSLTAQGTIAPSPITSDTGTHFTDFDEIRDQSDGPQAPLFTTTLSPVREATKSKTGLTISPVPQHKTTEDKYPISAIYAPLRTKYPVSESSNHVAIPTEETSPPICSFPTASIPIAKAMTPASEQSESQRPQTTVQTAIATANDWTKTPRAQTRQDFGPASRPQSRLASINESNDDQSATTNSEEISREPSPAALFRNAKDEIKALNNALTECWTLCNTLASLSNLHTKQMLESKIQQRTWTSCWQLCQTLYADRSNTPSIDVRHTLNLCRSFCQALFNSRNRDDEVADSVLRVSFELNNHLFNTHDRGMPEAFTQRTLDFYITLCHRLMKQRTSQEDEKSSLLKSCWSLTEMLFTLYQNKRDGKQVSEDLLSSAVQACWELCDLFRDGWVQIRPDRQTPRPSQPTLTQALHQSKQIDHRRSLELSRAAEPVRHSIHASTLLQAQKVYAETPTTIFSEGSGSNDSPYEAPAPNIMVLGSISDAQSRPSSVASLRSIGGTSQTGSTARQSIYRWPSISSAHSVSSTTASSSSNIASAGGRGVRSQLERGTQTEERALLMLQSLFIRAAMATNHGFTLEKTNTPLPQFVKSLPPTAFGELAWEKDLFNNYRKTVRGDPSFENLGRAADSQLAELTMSNPSSSARVREEVAQAVNHMIESTSGWGWLKDLFRYVFGVYMEDVIDQEFRPTSLTSARGTSTPRAESRRSSIYQVNPAEGHSRSSSGGSIASNGAAHM